jgi:oligopeptidase A
MQDHPFLSDAFHISWSRLTADHVVADLQRALLRAESRIDALCELDRGRMEFDAIFIGLEEATRELERSWGLVNHLDSVCNQDALREALNTMLPRVTEFFTSLHQNKALWDLLKTYANTGEASELAGIQKRLLEETMKDFRDHGADLPAEQREQLARVEEELARLTQKFSENVLDSTNAWELIIDRDDAQRLEGLPPSARAAALQAAIEAGKATEENPAWRFTLHLPSLQPILEHAEDASLRREAWEGRITIGRGGDYDNSSLIWEILKLRQEKAQLLGKEHFADGVTERRMAGSGARALEFIENLHKRVKSAFNREIAVLQEYRAERLHKKNELLQPWDVAYWSERRRKELYDFDDEELRPYFPISGVLKGMFELAERLFEVRIVERECEYIEPGSGDVTDRIEVWHPEVKFYDLLNADGVHLGSFYADWHPRAGKRAGAWMNYFDTGCPPRGEEDRVPHLGLILGNLTPPVGEQPALLRHDEVRTIFHEFGHLLHHLLGEVPYRALNGIHVAWDFVELPSQLMENFCWDRQSLDFFARHHETGKPIPARLLKKMLAARNYMSASAMMRQLGLSKLDLELHMHHASGPPEDLDKLTRTLLAEYLVPVATEPPSFARSFSHLFASPTGYAAGYYSYKWAEVLDADVFTRFQKEGTLDAEVGHSFREEILSKGSSQEPELLFRNFMGRDPDLKALLRRSGLGG